MASPVKDQTVAKKLVENLQTDLRGLSAEAKKKHPNIKEVHIYSSITMTITVNITCLSIPSECNLYLISLVRGRDSTKCT